MAPEMLTGASAERVEYSAAVDVFSFGIILWQMLTSEQPYAAELASVNRFVLLARIARAGLRPPIPPWAPPALASLIAECWAEGEHMRPTSAELLQRLRSIHDVEVIGLAGEGDEGDEAGGAAALEDASASALLMQARMRLWQREQDELPAGGVEALAS